MSTTQNSQQSRLSSGHIVTASVSVLLIHLFVVCYGQFGQPDVGPIGKVIDRLREVFQKLPFTGDEILSKVTALGLLIASYLFPGSGTPRKRDSYASPVAGLVAGVLLFLKSGSFASVIDSSTAILYIAVTSIGYLLATYGLGSLSTYFRYRQYLQQFHHDTGFRQEERRIDTEYSLNLPATYRHSGRKRKSWINIINPRRGVLILGSPGSGKSRFLIEPMIEQVIRQDRALFVYDFKYPALTQYTYDRLLTHQEGRRTGIRFYCVNFTDLSRSHRCNLIAPETLSNKSDAMAISNTILLSMNRVWTAKRGEFFVESPINYLAALIWFLRRYKNGAYCTLPHVIELSKASYGEVFTILNADAETRGLIGPFKDAFLNNTMEMLDGQVASTRIPLGRLDSPDFYYVLSGNDLDLDINDPMSPRVLCLGGDPQRQEALAPVLSLFIDRLNKRINKPSRHSCALVLDEFATIRAMSVLTTIATGRSNDIIPILAAQDMSQLNQQYSLDEAEQILNTCGNLFCGQVNGETAKWVSHRFHANAYLKTTVSINSSDTSVSQTEQNEQAVTPATLAQLSSGEFIGVVADDPETPLELKGFHATVSAGAGDLARRYQLPTVATVTQETIQENFSRIVREVEDIVQSEMKRILGDPALKKFVVKR